MNFCQERVLTDMNVCVVGYGAVGKVHADALSDIKGVTVYAICDINAERAYAGAQKHQCKSFTNFSDCLSDTNVDSVHIATPHYLHFQMIEKAVKANKIVFIEKPVVMKSEELHLLFQKYSDAPVYPVFQNRTNKCIQEIKAMDGLGKLVAVKGILTWQRTAEYYNSAEWRGTKKYEGGGVLINQAIHTLDLMSYIGGDVEYVSASASNKSLKGIIEVEDTVDAYLKFKNGATGVFYATNASACNDSPFIEFKYENAVIRYSDGNLYKNGEFLCSDDKSYRGKSYWGMGHEHLFYDYYVKGKTITLKDVKNTMNTVFAIYESAYANKEVKV